MKKRPAAKKPIPFEFVLEELGSASPYTKPMFGAVGVYVGDKIVFILREKPDSSPEDNGVWLATTGQHHSSLQQIFPNMRSLKMFGPGPTGWQILPVDASDFEESTVKACELVLRGDPRIGKIPQSRAKRTARKPK